MGPLRQILAQQDGVTLSLQRPFASTPTSVGSLQECADIGCNGGHQKHAPYDTLSLSRAVRQHKGKAVSAREGGGWRG